MPSGTPNPDTLAPLSATAVKFLLRLRSGPQPQREVNAGVAERLRREALIEPTTMPSPYATRKGEVEAYALTTAGAARLADVTRVSGPTDLRELPLTRAELDQIPFGRAVPPTRAEWLAHQKAKAARRWCVVVLHRDGARAQVTEHHPFDAVEMHQELSSFRAALADGRVRFFPLDPQSRFCAWPSPDAVARVQKILDATRSIFEAQRGELSTP